VFLACAGDGTGLDENGNPIVTTSGITLSLDEFALPVGQSLTLQATTMDADGNVLMGNTIAWVSSNPTVATVDASSGLVSAVGPGAVTITAQSDGATAGADGVVVVSAAFSTDVQPIFSANCAFSGCHAGPTPQAGQNLTQGNAYTSIVNVPSTEVPSMDRIEPGDPSRSYLVHKIRGTFAEVGGTGDQMPLGLGELQANEIDIIRAWVQAGALNN
jgi:hypothetical protein